MEKEIKSETGEGLVVNQKISKILLELLVYGKETDKDKIQPFLEKIQKQLDTKKAKHRTRILWCLHKEEKPFDEINKWFMENANCKYYVYANTYDNYDISDDFVSSVLDKIKNFEKGYTELKKADIKFYKD